MTCCIVKGCGSILTPSSPIMFHRLPKNPDLKKIWLSLLSLEDTYSSKARVCSLHFRKEDYESLKSDATPLRWVQNQPRFITISNGIVLPPAENSLELSSVDAENGSVASLKKTPTSRRPSKIDLVCRACLAAGCGTLALRGALRKDYEQLIGEPLSAQPSFPRRLCWECGARVLAAAHFRHKARHANRLLAALCPVGGRITLRDIASIDRRQHNLESQLSCKHFDANAYQVHVSESQGQINGEMEESEDPKEETIEEVEYLDGIEYLEGSDTEIYKNQLEEIFEHFDKKRVGVENVDSDSGNDNDDDGDDVGVVENSVNGIRDDSNEIIEGVDSNDVQLENVVESRDNDKVDVMDEDNDVKISKNRKKIPRKCKKNQNTRWHSIIKKSIPSAKSKAFEAFTITRLSVEEQIAVVQNRRWSRNYMDSAHKCEICYRGFLNQHSYAAHALKHTEKYGPLECTICKCRHTTRRNLQLHVASSHKFKSSCNLCDFVTFNRNVALSHSKYHAGVKYQCPHCPQQFQKATSYYSHVRYKHPCALPCPLCGHTFASQRGMEKHKKTVHLFAEAVTLEGPHCDTCDVTFASEDAHDKHLKLSSRHRSDTDENELRNDPLSFRNNYASAKTSKYACGVCGEEFDSRAECGQHAEWAHPGEIQAAPVRRPGAYMCDQCGNKFQCMAALRVHMPIHSGEVHECGECGKRFGRRINLLIHSNIHRAVPQTYACGVCGKRFSSYCNRRRHVNTVHLGVKKYECEACGKRFATSQEIRSHIDHVHNKIPWPKRQRRRVRTED